MRLKAIIFAFSIVFIGSAAVSEASAQRRPREYIGPPIVYQSRDRDGDHHRGWENRRYTYGYRNYGQYRRTQVGNRRYNSSYWHPRWADRGMNRRHNTSFWRPSWADRTRTSRYYTRDSRYYTRRD